jgi:hypothetical protein
MGLQASGAIPPRGETPIMRSTKTAFRARGPRRKFMNSQEASTAIRPLVDELKEINRLLLLIAKSQAQLAGSEPPEDRKPRP